MSDKSGSGVYDALYDAQQLDRIADKIVAEYAPETVLDAGCGIGFLVDALRRRGVEAYGFDSSEDAISQVPSELRPFCWVASVTDELDRDYDLVVCIEILEQLPPELVENAIRNLARHTSQILFSSTPDAVTPLETWVELFARRGFFRNLDHDPTFVSPHAVQLVRTTRTADAIARDYERRLARERKEIAQLREAEARAAREAARIAARLREVTQEAARLRQEASWWRDETEIAEAELEEWRLFRGRSGYRIFLRLASLRSKLAPQGTRRDRAVRRALRAFAEALDRSTGTSPGTSTRIAAVLLVSGCPGDAKRYRRDHQGAELALGGATVAIADDTDVDFDDALGRYESFILHRVPWSRDLARFIRDAHDRGKPVLYDTDDLVFEPEAHAHIAALLELDEAHRARYIASLRRQQRTLQECDGALVSTTPLRDAALRYNANVEVAYNAASDEMTHQADAALADRSPQAGEHETVTIAYFSGTATHNVDFAEAADAVLWALETYPHVRFLVVGLLTLDARFDAYADRVRHVPLQPWQKLPELLAQTDINLAPLEPRNPFTECKSCIKYVEAALVGTPTIASPRSDFVRAIEHGRNGLLADSPDEWRTTIRMLVESPERREEIGRAAFADVRVNHTVRARSRHLLRSVATLVRPDADAPLTVNWILNTEDAGAQRFLRLADYLGRQGHRVRVHVPESVESPHVEVRVGYAEIAPADATIATSATTAPVVAAHEQSLFKLYVGAEPDHADESFALPFAHVRLETDDEERAGAELQRILRETCFVRLPPPAGQLRGAAQT